MIYIYYINSQQKIYKFVQCYLRSNFIQTKRNMRVYLYILALRIFVRRSTPNTEIPLDPSVYDRYPLYSKHSKNNRMFPT